MRSFPESTARRRWPALSVLPFAAALVVAGVTRAVFAFDGLYGQDAFAYFRFARAIWPHVRWHAPLPDLYWPRGYPAAVALLLPLFGGSPAAGQMVSALACAVAAAATYGLVRAVAARSEGRVASGPAALVAGLAVACSGAVLRSSQVVMSDGLGLGLAAVALLCAVRCAQDASGPWLVGCAVALAWALVTRWVLGLLALPVGVYLLIELGRRSGDRQALRALVPWLVIAALAGLAVVVPQLIAARANPGSLEGNEWLWTWRPQNILARHVHTPEGEWTYRLPIGVFYLVRLGWPDYFFPTLGVLAAVGLWAMWRARWGSLAVLLLGWLIVSWLFLSGVPYETARYLLPTLPVVAALVGLGVGALWQTSRPRTRGLIAIAVGASLAAGLVGGAGEHARQVERKDAELDLVRWTVEHVSPDADLLMASGPTLAVEHYTGRRPQALFSTSDAELRALVSRSRRLFVLADVGLLESQWKGLPPQRRLAMLQRDPGLDTVGQRQQYTLFAVRASAP